MADPILITDTELQGDLKYVYADYRTQLFPIVVPLMAAIKKEGPGGVKNMQWGGRGVQFDVVVNPPVNWGSSDAGYLPRSSEATEVQASVGIRRLYVTRQFDMLAIVGTATKDQAFVSLRQKITDEIDGAMQLGVQNQLQGNGLAIQAIIGTASTTTSIIVTSPYGVSGAGQGGLWLYPGMYIAVRDTTGATLRGKAVISAVSNSGDNATLTLATAIAGMVATDIVVPATDNDDAYNQFTNGLINITNRGGSYASLHGVSASTYARWNAYNATASDVDNVNAPNELDAWNLAAVVAARSGKNALTNPGEFIALAPYTIQKKMIASVIGQRRLNVTGAEKISLPGGYQADSLLGIPFVPDQWTPAGTFYLMHRPSLAWVDAADWSPVQYENSGAVRWITGRDAFETSYKQYWQIATTQRNAHGVIPVYTDTGRITPVM